MQEQYKEFENEYEKEPKEVKRVFPEMIYPKNDDSQRSREYILAELIEKSHKKGILLQILSMR